MLLTPEQEAEVRRAAEEAQSRDPELRRAGLKHLQQIGASGLEPLLALFQSHMAKRRRVRIALTVLTWLLFCISVLLMPSVMFSICVGGAWGMSAVALSVWTVDLLLFVMRSRVPMTIRQREIVDVFTEINDLRAIGPIIDALGPQPENDPPMLRITLTRLLKQIHASDAALLTPRHRAVLYRELLQHKPDAVQVDFILAILKALEQVGTTAAMTYVAQLAQRTYPRPAPPDVMEAAWRCLDYLRDHAGELKTRQTLLRASTPNASRLETLLRPAQEQQQSQSETLLRPDTPPVHPPDKEDET